MGRNAGVGAGGGSGAASRGPKLGTRFVSGSELAHATLNGEKLKATNAERIEQQRRLFRSGRAGENTVTVAVKRDGTLDVVDGRHRILAANEPEFRHVKLKVKFVRGL